MGVQGGGGGVCKLKGKIITNVITDLKVLAKLYRSILFLNFL